MATTPNGIVTVLTDFGTTDGYVAAMKGALLTVNQSATIVDVTHHIPTQDVTEAAFQLATVWSTFPEGTTHLVVVDPGVGGSRRAIGVELGGHFFICPDNGVLTLILGNNPAERAVQLDSPKLMRGEVSSTFHGRDIFAPMAGYLSGGIVEFDDLGSAVHVDSIVSLAWSAVREGDVEIRAPIVSIDRFGNCRTLITRASLPWDPADVYVNCGDVTVRGIHNTYSDVPIGKTLALFGSHGGLEIAVRQGSAAASWELNRGDIVTVSPAPARSREYSGD
ncbi:MAG: SAM hydrolase/SAM-dependent halogenase family protein [Chloroflexota bacterium]